MWTSVAGPNARKLLQKVSPHDWSNGNHPFGTAKEIELGMCLARAHRVTYVGELGWELYVSSDMAGHAFETLMDAGQDLGLKLCGMHMMDCCRIEKGYRHFGHDISSEDHVLEAGLGFAVKTSKAEFIGRDALRRHGGCAIVEPWHGHRDRRASAWQRTGHCGQRCGKPGRCHAERSHVVPALLAAARDRRAD